MIGLLVSGSHSYVDAAAPLAPPRPLWRRIADWFLGR
jgi:hypothetical protein